MIRTWTICRQPSPRRDGERRWDQACQLLVRWTERGDLPWTTPPFGYRLDPERPRQAAGVRVEQAEAVLVAQLFDWYLEPQATVYRLARRLTDLHVATPTGKPRWNAASGRGILRNPAYVGRAQANRTRVVPARRRKSALLSFLLGPLPGDAGVQELPLERVQLRGVLVGPLPSGGEPCPAVQLVRVLAGRPVLGGAGQVAVDAKALAVLVQPVAQRRPFTDQGLVGHLDGLILGGHQPRLDQPVEHGAEVGVVAQAGGELGARGPPASVLGGLPELGEAQEDAAGDPLLPVMELLSEHRVGGPGDRLPHPPESV
jgi:hypothetical protein